jgi:hypothetical protein
MRPNRAFGYLVYRPAFVTSSMTCSAAGTSDMRFVLSGLPIAAIIKNTTSQENSHGSRLSALNTRMLDSYRGLVEVYQIWEEFGTGYRHCASQVVCICVHTHPQCIDTNLADLHIHQYVITSISSKTSKCISRKPTHQRHQGRAPSMSAPPSGVARKLLAAGYMACFLHN